MTGQSQEGSRRRVGRLVGAAVMTAMVLGIASCGGQQSNGPRRTCGRYRWLSPASTRSAAATGTPTADAIRRRSEAALARLDEPQAVSEGRLTR